MEQLKNDLTILPTQEEVSSTGDGQTQKPYAPIHDPYFLGTRWW